MMDELVEALSQKTGLSQDKSQEVVTFLVGQLKQRLPAPVSSELDNLLAGNAAAGGNLLDEAKSLAEGLGIFGKKPQ